MHVVNIHVVIVNMHVVNMYIVSCMNELSRANCHFI